MDFSFNNLLHHRVSITYLLLTCSARLCVGPYLSHQHSEGYHKNRIFLYARYLYNKACSCCNIHDFFIRHAKTLQQFFLEW
jgi:hypothetical protein